MYKIFFVQSIRMGDWIISKELNGTLGATKISK